MATISIDPNVSFNINSLDLSLLRLGEITASTGTRFEVSFGNGVAANVLEGTGFGYGPDGFPNAGTVTRFFATVLTEAGVVTAYDIAGISVAAARVSDASATSSRNDDVALFQAALSGNDTFAGSNLRDTVITYDGNDTLTGNGGDDRLDGGAGADTASYTGSASGVTVNLLTGRGTGGDAEGDRLSNIENVNGSSFDDTFVSNTEANRFDGGDGSDTVSYAGSGAGVTVNLGLGGLQQQSPGNASNDVLTDIENLIGSGSNDVLTGTSGTANVLEGGAGADILNGDGFIIGRVAGGFAVQAADDDTASYASSSAGVTVDLRLSGPQTSAGDASGDTLLNIEDLLGSRFNDTFGGNGVANGFDGGRGTDTVQYANATTGVTADLIKGGTNDLADGDTYTRIENLVGSDFNDRLVGDANNNRLTGGAGNDVLIGRGGSDTLIGGEGSDRYFIDNPGDRVSETGTGAGDVDNVYTSVDYALGAGIEGGRVTGAAGLTLTGNSLDNILVGGRGTDTLFGGIGRDTILGGAGVDRISGGADVDNLYGGTGDDIFVFARLSDSPNGERDRIRDFTEGDRIDLSGIATQAANEHFTFSDAGNFSDVAGELIAVVREGYTAIFGDTQGDGRADLAILLTDTTATIDSGDFILV